MAKDYSKEEIKKLLKKHFNALSVGSALGGYDDEFYVTLKGNDDFKTGTCMTVEVVSLKTAISNESDFGDKDSKLDFYKNLVEIFVNEEELVKIGAYTKLAENLFWREY